MPELVTDQYEEIRAWLLDEGFQPTEKPSWAHTRLTSTREQDLVSHWKGSHEGSEIIYVKLATYMVSTGVDPSRGILRLNAWVDWKDHERTSNDAVVRFVESMRLFGESLPYQGPLTMTASMEETR